LNKQMRNAEERLRQVNRNTGFYCFLPTAYCFRYAMIGAHETFFLMAVDAPDAYLNRGRPISLDELLLTSNLASPSATARIEYG
jgi:hypothetical protein